MEHTDKAEGPKRPRRWTRRLMWAVLGLMLLMVLSVALLPWYLGTESARRWMLARAAEAMKPARLDISAFRFSWFGPTRLTGFTIIDAEGAPVVKSRLAVWDRNLFQVLFDRPNYGTLTLEDAALDVEREPNGQVDLYEALRPVLNGPPETSLTIQIRGRLRLSSPGLERPIEGRNLALSIHRPPAPEPYSWSLELREPVGNPVGKTTPTLSSQGTYNRWKPQAEGHHDLVFSVQGHHWPLWIGAEGVRGQASWTGRVDPTLHSGLWRFQGKGELASVTLEGTRLAGNRLTFDRLTGSWGVSETEKGWRLDSLDAKGDIGAVKTVAQAPGGPWTALEGWLDVAKSLQKVPTLAPSKDVVAIDQGRLDFRLDRPNDDRSWDLSASFSELSLRQGPDRFDLPEPATLHISLANRRENDAMTGISAQSRVPQLIWSSGEDSTRLGPLSLSLDATFQDLEQGLDLQSVALTSPWGALKAGGRLSDLSGGCRAELSGTIEPDWARLNDKLAREIEPGARIQGQPAQFELGVSLAGEDVLAQSQGRAEFKLDELDIYGMRLRKAALSVSATGKTFAIEPIDASLNGGRVHLEPVLSQGPDGSWTMTLDPNSRIEGAEVNDEVSRRVLSYVAPVLDRATRVNGRVSASFTKAEFPIGPDLAGKARVEGKVVFDDVAFEPGPLAENIMALAGREARTITLDEPVLLTIADGKVHQEGLKVPIGNLTEFAVRGDVGFDESLDLTASIPMTAQMFKDMPVVGSIVDGARVNVPIGGTLSKPRIDRDEFRAQLKVLERDLLQRTATRGAAELLFRLAQPRPRGEDGLTPRERRQQRRMERRQREQRSTP